MNIKAIIFDWARTLFDRDNNKEFTEAEEVLKYCQGKAYRMAVVSLVTAKNDPGTTMEDREKEMEQSPLRKYFEMALVTDGDKDKLFDQVVAHFNVPRDRILIVDDRTVRGIKYGNKHGHPTVWLQKGKFADELPSEEMGQPTHIVSELIELLKII